MGWLFLAPALFGIWKYRYFAYWRWVLWVGVALYAFAALFWASGTLSDPTQDGLITGAVRQATGDGPEVLWGLLALVATVAICVLLLRRAHQATKPPYPGGDAARSASWPRKLVESIGLGVAVFCANLLLGGFLAYTQTQIYGVVPHLPEADRLLSPLEREVLSSAAQINNSAPTQIDEITLLTRASADGETLVYHYDIDSNATPTEIEESMAPRIMQGICSDATMMDAMREGASFRYQYTNANGQIAAVQISETNCRAENPTLPDRGNG